MSVFISVLLPVMDEVSALQETVKTLLGKNRAYIKEIIIITSPFSTAGSLRMAEELKSEEPNTICILRQTRRYLGGALQDGIEGATGSAILLMAADLETDPNLVLPMVEVYKNLGARSIVATSRWAKGGMFTGYNPLKKVLNFIFQGVVRIALGIKLTDSTFAFRLYPADALRGHDWRENRHAFLFEALVRPVSLGWPYVEIPARWSARAEGKSHNSFALNFLYFRVLGRAILEKLSKT
jgi:glycosyltransferase involved in cell wall biosynthesis